MTATNQPANRPARAKKPSPYDARTQRRIKLARVGRDLVGVAFGIALLVYYFVQPGPTFLGGGAAGHSHSDPGWSVWAEPVGIFLIAVCGVLALFNAATVYRRKWRPRTRWIWSVLGLLLGAYFIVGGLTVNGFIGQRTVTADEVACHRMTNQRSSSHWYDCDMLAHWPDGTTSVVRNVGQEQHQQDVTVVRPAFRPWPFAGDPHGDALGDTLSLLAVGILFAGQALVCMGVLVVGAANRARRPSADLPPGQLPV